MGPTETGAPGLPAQADLPAVLARIDERLAALEAALGAAARPSEDEVSRLAWAVKHGRQRPW